MDRGSISKPSVNRRTWTSESPDTNSAEQVAWRIAWRTLLLAGALSLGVWLLSRLGAALVLVLLAVILAAGMSPLVDRLTARRRTWRVLAGRPWSFEIASPPRGLVVLALYLLFVILVVVLAGVLLPPLLAETEDLVTGLPEDLAALQQWVAALGDRYPFLPPALVVEAAGQRLLADAFRFSELVGQALVLFRVARGVMGGVLDTVFVLILALYLTHDGRRIQRYVIGLFPSAPQHRLERVADEMGSRLGHWLLGQLVLSGIIGAITLMGLTVLGVRYAVLLALVAAVGEAIPIVGPIASAVPATAVALLQSPRQALLVILLYLLIQQAENQLIVPRVMARAVAIHPVAVLLALLAGGELFGFAGAVLAVPGAAVLAVVVEELRGGRWQSPTERESGSPGTV